MEAEFTFLHIESENNYLLWKDIFEKWNPCHLRFYNLFFCVVFLAVMPTGASLVFFCETARVTSDIHRSVKTSWWSFLLKANFYMPCFYIRLI